MATASNIPPKRLALLLDNSDDLFRHYMPLIKDGGIFVPTQEPFDFHENVVIQVALQSENKKILVPGVVVWITPPNHGKAGVGIRFAGEQKSTVKRYIETLIAKRMLNPGNLTPVF